MCRLLLVKSKRKFDPGLHLRCFSQIARRSREFQGHGWGCACLVDGKWRLYRNIKPIWEDNLHLFPLTTCLLAHARSAFRDEGIRVENNMPFHDGGQVFIFNGELRKVKINQVGRIGAEKIFNYLKRFWKKSDTSFESAFRKGIKSIRQRTGYIRGMNIIMADQNRAYLHTLFSEQPDYFTLYGKKTSESLVYCSAPYPGEAGWVPIPNDNIGVII